MVTELSEVFSFTSIEKQLPIFSFFPKVINFFLFLKSDSENSFGHSASTSNQDNKTQPGNLQQDMIFKLTGDPTPRVTLPLV